MLLDINVCHLETAHLTEFQCQKSKLGLWPKSSFKTPSRDKCNRQTSLAKSYIFHFNEISTSFISKNVYCIFSQSLYRSYKVINIVPLILVG